MGKGLSLCDNTGTVQQQLLNDPAEKKQSDQHNHHLQNLLLKQKQQHSLPAHMNAFKSEQQPKINQKSQEEQIKADIQLAYIQMRQKQQQFEKAKQDAELKLLKIHQKEHKDQLEQWLQVLLQKYERCQHLYNDHDVDTAHEYVVQIRNLIKDIIEKKHLDHDGLFMKLDEYISKHKKYKYASKQVQCKILIIQREYKDILMYQDIISKTQFIFQEENKGVRVSTKKQEKSVGVLIQLQINVQFQKLIAILTQLDYFYQFVPYVQTSRKEKQMSRNCKIGYGVANFPIITRRQYYFQGLIYDRLKHTGQLFMYVRSIQDKPDIQKILQFIPQMNKDYVPLNYRYFVLKYKPISKGIGKIKFALNVDIGLDFIPTFVEQIAIKTFANEFFSNILKLSKKFQGSKCQLAVQKNPQTFDFFRLKIDQQVNHLQKQKDKKSQIKK